MKVYKTFQLNKILTKISNAKKPPEKHWKITGKFQFEFLSLNLASHITTQLPKQYMYPTVKQLTPLCKLWRRELWRNLSGFF